VLARGSTAPADAADHHVPLHPGDLWTDRTDRRAEPGGDLINGQLRLVLKKGDVPFRLRLLRLALSLSTPHEVGRDSIEPHRCARCGGIHPISTRAARGSDRGGESLWPALSLQLTRPQKADLVEFLKSLW